MILNVHHLVKSCNSLGPLWSRITLPVLLGDTIPPIKGTRQQQSFIPAYTLHSSFPVELVSISGFLQFECLQPGITARILSGSPLLLGPPPRDPEVG